MPEKRPLTELLARYMLRKRDIEKRLADFEKKGNAAEEEIYAEMAFCMLTPQSNAKRCWAAVEELGEKGLLMGNDANAVKTILRKKVRFHNNKAGYIIKNKAVFVKGGKMEIKNTLSQYKDAGELRSWLVKNVKGYGLKEASHFLRNIGIGEDIAILDRHILKNLQRYSVIKEVPKSLTAKKYMEIEEKMKKFCEKNKIPMSHLDLLFWSEETGEIFK